jgi:polyhydroxybutyrate depolymerase
LRPGIIRLGFLCALLLMPAAVLVAEGGEEPALHLAPGDYSFSMKFDGVDRGYVVHMPPQAAAGEPLPVVLNFHGAGSNGKQQEHYSKMDAAADRDGFIAVYPNGSSRFGSHYTWNAGFCCLYAMTHRIDDVGFVIALIGDLAARTPIEPRRVYATGISNGAMMCYRLATQASSHIAAIAPVAGTMVTTTFMPDHPMPIMHFHSVDDPYVRYQGGIGNAVASLFGRNAGTVGIEKMLSKWIEYDGCPNEPQVSPTISGKPDTSDAGITVTRYQWSPCRNGTEIVLWKFTGSGHVWPGGIQNRFVHFLGRSTNLIDANEEMWRFFQQFELPGQ